MCKLFYSDRQQISDYLGMERGKEELQRGMRKLFWGDGHVHHLDGDDGFMVYT